MAINEAVSYGPAGEYTISVRRFSDSIIIVQNRGDLAYFDSDRYSQVIEKFLVDGEIREPYVEIRSFSHLGGISDRRELKKHLNYLMKNSHRLAGIIFCDTPPWIKSVSLIAYRVIRKKIPFRIVGTVDEACRIAGEMLKEKKLTERYPSLLKKRNKAVSVSKAQMEEIVTLAGKIYFDEEEQLITYSPLSPGHPLEEIGEILEMLIGEITALREESELHKTSTRQILSSIEEAVIITEKEKGEILLINPVASALTGIYRDRDSNPVIPSYLGVNTFFSGREELEFTGADGSVSTWLKSADSIRYMGSDARLITLLDITGLKNAEMERTESREKQKESRKMLLSIMEDMELSFEQSRELNMKISENEEFQKLILTVANLGIWDLDLSTGKLNFNRRFYEMTGYENGEFPGDPAEFEKRIHPEDRMIIGRSMENIRQGMKGDTLLDFRFKKKDGSYMWLQGRSRNIGAGDGKFKGRYLGVFSDIDREKRKEEAYEQINAMQSFLLEQFPLNSKFSIIVDTVFGLDKYEMAAIWLYDPRRYCRENCFTRNLVGTFQCHGADRCFKLSARRGMEYIEEKYLERISGNTFGIDREMGSRDKSFMIAIEPGDKLLMNSEPLNLTGYKLIDPDWNITGILIIISKNPIDEDMRFYMETISRLASQVIINDTATRKLQEALDLSERANNLMEGRETRIRQIKDEINTLSRELGRGDVYNTGEISKLIPVNEKSSDEESMKNALSLAEDAEIARRETMEINDQLSLIRQAVNNSSDAIAISTLTGDFYYINNTFISLLGFSIDRLAILPTELLFENPDIAGEILEAVRSGGIWQNRTNVYRENNNLIPVFLRTSLFSDDRGNPVGLIWTMTDITEQIESEKKILEYTRTIEKDLDEKKETLRKAVLLQKSFIQQTLPPSDNINMEAFFLPCENLGGDFFRIERNVFENKIFIIVGDCTDHGFKASMDASLLASLIDPHKELLYHLKTDVFLAEISRKFSAIADEDQFPTMLVMVIDEFSGEITYSNANGELPFLIRKGKIETLAKAAGLHLGYLDNPLYEKKTFLLKDGDRLLYFSDAIPEMKKSGSRGRLGYGGLIEEMGKAASDGEGCFSSLIHQIEELHGGFPLEDDLTLISMEYRLPLKKEYAIAGSDEIPPFIDEIREDLEKRGFTGTEINRTEIALREMVLNGINHGNRNDRKKKVTVSCSISCSGWEFVIEDEGEGFSKGQVPDPVSNIKEILDRDDESEYTHGRGIVITEQFTDSLIYSLKGNCVILRMEKQARPVLSG